MRIKVYPEQSGENQFIENIRRQLAHIAGAHTEGVPLNHARLLLRLPYDAVNRADLTITNWLENNVCSSSGKLSVLGCIKFVGLLLVFRLTSKRLIYVRHNLYPHRLKCRYSYIAKAVVDKATSLLCERVALSEHMIDHGYCYIPHPLYRLPSAFTGGEGEDSSVGNYFVIFGTISRYKRIEKVVQAWTGDRRLLVIGKVGDVDYLNELKAFSEGKNVVIRGELLSDTEASSIISRSWGVILPHDSEEMIVSGAFFYSVALGARTYAIRNSFYESLVRHQPFPGLELFDEPESLVERLLYAPSEFFSQDKEVIRSYAQGRFGDEAGIAAWEAVIADGGQL